MGPDVADSDDGDQRVQFGSAKEWKYWRFEGRRYADNEDLSADEVRALLITREQRRRATINRAQTIAPMADAPPPPTGPGGHPRRHEAPGLTRI
jgi:hypothetical protein